MKPSCFCCHGMSSYLMLHVLQLNTQLLFFSKPSLPLLTGHFCHMVSKETLGTSIKPGSGSAWPAQPFSEHKSELMEGYRQLIDHEAIVTSNNVNALYLSVSDDCITLVRCRSFRLRILANRFDKTATEQLMDGWAMHYIFCSWVVIKPWALVVIYHLVCCKDSSYKKCPLRNCYDPIQRIRSA